MRPIGCKRSGCRRSYRAPPRCCCRCLSNCFFANGLTPRFLPGKAACVAALLDNGAAHHVQTPLNPTAVTPMLLAAAFDHEECVCLLASHNPAGACHAVCNRNFSPLLTSRPAAAHACDANGVTPLMMAAAHASLRAVDALLKAGAREAAVDAFGRRCDISAACAGLQS